MTEWQFIIISQFFDEMGVEYPKEGWTWDDLLATAQALTNDTHYGIVANPDSNTGYQNNYILEHNGVEVDLNIETQWDEYLTTLEKMNVQQYIDTYQKYYDAYMANAAK